MDHGTSTDRGTETSDGRVLVYIEANRMRPPPLQRRSHSVDIVVVLAMGNEQNEAWSGGNEKDSDILGEWYRHQP